MVQSTQFLALDKCLPERKYLELIEIPHDPNQSLELSYDPQWLAILRSTNHLLNVRPTTSYMPGPGAPNADRWDFFPTEEELESVTKIFNNDFKIPLNFTPTAEPFKPRPDYLRDAVQLKQQINPQTSQLCEKLGIDDPVALLIGNPVILTAPELANAVRGILNKLMPSNFDKFLQKIQNLTIDTEQRLALVAKLLYEKVPQRAFYFVQF